MKVALASSRAHHRHGDRLAQDEKLNIGLPFATLITGTIFILVLLIWRSRKNQQIVVPAEVWRHSV